jgi:arylsulfatase
MTAGAALLAALASGGCVEPAGRTSLLIIVLDAARVDHFGAHGYDRETTPNFDALSSEAVVFDHAVSDASYTTASIASLLSGEPPGRHQVVDFDGRVLDGSITTLAEVLLGAGYRTAAFVENPLIRASGGYEQGFETYRMLVEDWRPGQTARREIDLSRSRDHVAEMIGWLRGVPDEADFFLYVHLLRPHNPYHALPEHRGRFSRAGSDAPRGGTAELRELGRNLGRLPPEHLQQLIDLYDENLLSADALMAEIVAGLGQRLDSTIVVVTSDHGEAFGEHGVLLHGLQLFEEQVRVPLLIRFPPAMDLAPRRVGETVQLTDLMPTLLAAMGLADRAVGLSGRNLLPLLRGEAPKPREQPVISHALGSVSLREAPLKLIVPKKAAGRRRGQLFHLEDDPDERRNLSRRRKSDASAMRQRLDDELAAQQAGAPRGAERRLDEEMIEQMRALGYTADEEGDLPSPDDAGAAGQTGRSQDERPETSDD